MITASELKKNLNLSEDPMVIKALKFIERELISCKGHIGFYCNGYSQTPLNDAKWGYVREVLIKNGYKVSTCSNSHGVEYHRITV